MIEMGKNYKSFSTFSLDPNVKLNPYHMNMIKNDEDMNGSKYEYFRGVAYRLKGWKEHFCDCEFCEKEYEDVKILFTSKEDAEKHAENFEVKEPKIEEDGYFIKAVRQNTADFGLFKEVV